MAPDRLGMIGWLFVAILVSGLCKSFAGKFLHGPLDLAHKLLALFCLFLLLRVTVRVSRGSPVLPVAFVVFVVAYLAAFVTGLVQSIPAAASSLWLNLHRFSSAIAAIACAVAARLVGTAASPANRP